LTAVSLGLPNLNPRLVFSNYVDRIIRGAAIHDDVFKVGISLEKD